MSVRKPIAILAALVAGVVAFGSVAGPASADVANPIRKSFSTPGVS